MPHSSEGFLNTEIADINRSPEKYSAQKQKARVEKAKMSQTNSMSSRIRGDKQFKKEDGFVSQTRYEVYPLSRAAVTVRDHYLEKKYQSVGR